MATLLHCVGRPDPVKDFGDPVSKAVLVGDLQGEQCGCGWTFRLKSTVINPAVAENERRATGINQGAPIEGAVLEARSVERDGLVIKRAVDDIFELNGLHLRTLASSAIRSSPTKEKNAA